MNLYVDQKQENKSLNNERISGFGKLFGEVENSPRQRPNYGQGEEEHVLNLSFG